MRCKMQKQKKKALLLGGLSVGFINGLFGAGGGMLAVPMLKKYGGLEQRQAHINSVALILPLTVISAAFYVLGGRVTLAEPLIFVPGGIVGAVIGTAVIQKIPDLWFRRIFGVFMIWAGWRLISK